MWASTTNADRNAGRSCGMMIRRYSLGAEAPSICAALMISLSMPRRPGQEHRHDEPGRLPHRGDHDAIDRQSRTLIQPNWKLSKPQLRTTCSTPMPGSRNHFQAVPVTMNDSAIG